MTLRRLAGFGAPVIVLTVACEGAPATRIEPLWTELPQPSIGAWSRAGEPVPRNILSLREGPEHCGWDSLVILTTGRQLGVPYRRSDEAHTFVRDPEGVVGHHLVAAYESSVLPPDDAAFSGYRSGSLEIWLSPEAGDSAVYVVRGGVWERWPRSREVLGCS